MYRLVVVLFTLNSDVVCNALRTMDYQQPTATSYAAREDDPGDGKTYGFGFSKKFGYNKMVVATYLAPSSPEESAASYSNYVIHPVDKERFGYKVENKASLAENPIVIEDTAETSSFLKMFPIVVEEGSETEEPQEEPKGEFKGYRERVKEQDGDSYRSWFFKEEPKGKNILDEEVQDLYLSWFEKEGPRSTTSEGYWKSFKNNFDTFYEDEFKQFFGDDVESDGNTKEDKSDKQKKEETDWFPDIPYHYEYEDKSDDSGDKKEDKWNYFYEPKRDFRPNYDSNGKDEFYKWWREW